MPATGPDSDRRDTGRPAQSPANEPDFASPLAGLRGPRFPISPGDIAQSAEKRPAIPQIQSPKALPSRTEPYMLELAAHVDLFDLPGGCADILKKSLCAARPEVENAPLATLLMRSALFDSSGAANESEASVHGGKSGLKSIAERVGAAFFLSELARKDPGLIEMICEFYAGREIDLDNTISRLTAFWEKEKYNSLLLAHTLMLRETRGDNSVLASQVIAGMLRPFLDLSHKTHRGFFERFECPTAQFSFLLGPDRDWRTRDSMLLNSLLAKAPQRSMDDVACDPVLKFIFAHLSSDEDILKALSAFTEKAESLSVDDLFFLTRRMPRGVDSGEMTSFADIALATDLGPAFDGRVPTFRSDDLKILLVALRKTTIPVGAERLGEVGKNVRNIVDRSHSLAMDYPKTADKKFAQSLMNFYVEEFAAVVKRIVVDPGKEGLEIE